jgi:hypothetical protein
MKTLLRMATVALVLAGGCGKRADATRANFEEGLRAYLERRGDLCLGKPAWPIDVSPRDVAASTREALQMPVFERLGLARSSDVTVDVSTADGTVPVEVKRYELTEAGLRDYRSHEIGVNVSGDKVAAGDFCVAKLSLSRVTRWEILPTAGDARPKAVVSYRYEVAAEPWTRDPEVQRVLPAVARVVNGARSSELKESFTLTGDGWVADELLPGEVRFVSNRPAAPGNP